MLTVESLSNRDGQRTAPKGYELAHILWEAQLVSSSMIFVLGKMKIKKNVKPVE